jgi:hypothetical protein
MRLRQAEVLAPPARLVAFDPADWTPLVGEQRYNPENHRLRSKGGAGPVTVTLAQWQHSQAYAFWTQARLDWCELKGWPGGLSVVDLLREQRLSRRRA